MEYGDGSGFFEFAVGGKPRGVINDVVKPAIRLVSRGIYQRSVLFVTEAAWPLKYVLFW